MKRPIAKKIPHSITQHGQTRIDNYAWLRDDNWKDFINGDLNFNNPEVKKYIEEENAYTDNYFAPLKDLKESIYNELLSRVKEDDEATPVPKGKYLYYSKIEKGENYHKFCRKLNTANAFEEIYFDTNLEASHYDLYMLKGRKLNQADTYLAYAYNTSGSLEATIKVRNLETLNDFHWKVENCNGSYLWADNETIYYVERDEFSRGKNIYCFNIHEGPEKKQLIFTKPDEMTNMFMSISKTSDEKYCIINLGSGASTEVFYKKFNEDKFIHFISGKDDITYGLDHWDDHFYIHTNHNEAHNYQMFKTANNKPAFKDWELIIPEREDVYLYEANIQAGFIVMKTKNTKIANPELRLYEISTKTEKLIHFEEEVYNLDIFGAYDPHNEVIRVYYESSIRPEQDIDINLKTGQVTVLHTEEVPNYNHDLYQVHREYADSHDGKKIPMTIITKKGFVKDGSAPSFVYAYGSYGHAIPAYFNQSYFSLIDRGFSVTIAHIRGGDDCGNEWYLDGKMRNKLNTFKDYISCVEYLIKNKYTQKGMVTANGGSAGGMLMGAVANMRPDLFKCVIADVAFVDVINTISDASLPLTQPEWEEWGNPIENEDDFNYMMQYSPYDNVKAQNYPHMLYNSGISDEQVTYWEPLKMVAKLSELKTDNNKLFLHLKMNAGHAGASKRYEWIEDKALNYTFILDSYK